MLPDRVSNPGPLTYESGALPIALRVPASSYSGCNVPRGLLPFLATHTGEKLYTVCYPHWKE